MPWFGATAQCTRKSSANHSGPEAGKPDLTLHANRPPPLNFTFKGNIQHVSTEFLGNHQTRTPVYIQGKFHGVWGLGF